METAALLLRLLNPWTCGFLRLSLTIALISSLTKISSLHAAPLRYSWIVHVSNGAMEHDHKAYDLNLHQSFLHKPFRVPEVLHSPTESYLISL